MVRAVAADFLDVPGCRVHVLRDARLLELELPPCEVTRVTDARIEQAAFLEQCRCAHWTV